ncbi:MAG: DUF2341 domain-containing protein [Candidatus Hodarchaeota archaeon]
MRSRKRIVAFVLVMLFFFPTLPTIVSASPDGESWLVGWSYRKSHVINSAFGAGTNYQVNIVVHYGSGTDSGFDIFCGGKCKPDFGDVRFTDNDGITLLDYWMEKKTDSDKATFWVEIADDLSTSDVTIYIYYGNPAASTTSDGDATFILFDSYDDNSLDASKWNWQLDNNNASSVHLAEQNQRMESWKDVGSGVSGANYRESDDSWALERIVEFELYVDYDRTSIGGYAHQWLVWYQDDNNKLMCTHGSYNSTHFRIILESVEGGSHNPGEWGYFSWDTWYYVRTRIDPTSIVLEVFSGGFDETIEHVTYLSHTRTGYGRFHNRICSSSSATDGFRYFDDDFRVRKYTYPEPSHGSWGTEESNWLTGWSHRKSHTINPASGAGTDYQIRITVNFGAGTDNGENAYCDSQCRADFGDIRFTDDDGVTELDYWMEEKVDFNYGVFWVEIRDDLSTTSATIFMYYGNSTATTTSNGTETFLWFDDFIGNSLDNGKWNEVGGPEISVSGSECSINSDGGDGIVFENAVDYDDVRIDHKAKRNDYNRRHTYSLKIGTVPHLSNIIWHHSGVDESPMQEDITYTVFDGSWSGLDVVIRDVDTNQYYLFSQWKTTDQYKPSIYALNYTQLATTTTRTVSDNSFKYQLFVHDIGNGNSTLVLDWVRIRKYVSPEPSHGIWGDLPPQDGQQDLTIILIATGIGAVAAIGIAAFLKARSPRPEVAIPEPRRPVIEPSHEEEPMPEEITPEREEVEEPRRVLPSDVLCSYCGYVNPAGAKFCIRCGRNLE